MPGPSIATSGKRQALTEMREDQVLKEDNSLRAPQLTVDIDASPGRRSSVLSLGRDSHHGALGWMGGVLG